MEKKMKKRMKKVNAEFERELEDLYEQISEVRPLLQEIIDEGGEDPHLEAVYNQFRDRIEFIEEGCQIPSLLGYYDVFKPEKEINETETNGRELRSLLGQSYRKYMDATTADDFINDPHEFIDQSAQASPKITYIEDSCTEEVFLHQIPNF